jgi:hypothetical protein
MSVLKNPIKPKKTRFEVGFLGVFFWFYWAGFLLPTLALLAVLHKGTQIYIKRKDLQRSVIGMHRISSRIIRPFLYPVSGRILDCNAGYPATGSVLLFIYKKKKKNCQPKYPDGYPVLLGIRLLDLPYIRSAGYPAKTVSSAFLID